MDCFHVVICFCVVCIVTIIPERLRLMSNNGIKFIFLFAESADSISLGHGWGDSRMWQVVFGIPFGSGNYIS